MTGSSNQQSPIYNLQSFRSCLALLPLGVAWPPHYCGRRWSLTPPFHPYLGIVDCRFLIADWSSGDDRNLQSAIDNLQSRGGKFLWPGPANYFTPGVTRQRALWSADFPRKGILSPPQSVCSVKGIHSY